MDEALKRYKAIEKGLDEIYGGLNHCLTCAHAFPLRIPERLEHICRSSNCGLYASAYGEQRRWNERTENGEKAMGLVSNLLKKQGIDIAKLVKEFNDWMKKIGGIETAIVDERGDLYIDGCSAVSTLLEVVAEKML